MRGYKWSVFLFLLAAFPAYGAESSLRNIQITPFAGFTVGGEVKLEDENNDATTIDLDETGNYGLTVNWPSRFPTEWEVYYNHQGSKVKDTGADITIDTLQLGGTYLGSGNTALPYFVATAGLTRIKPESSGSDYYLGFSTGGGWKFFPTKRLGLRLEGRILGTVISSSSQWFCGVNNGGTCAFKTTGNMLWQFQANAGLVFRF